MTPNTLLGALAHLDGHSYEVKSVSVISGINWPSAPASSPTGCLKLVLVTCEDYYQATGHYASNVVVVLNPVFGDLHACCSSARTSCHGWTWPLSWPAAQNRCEICAFVDGHVLHVRARSWSRSGARSAVRRWPSPSCSWRACGKLLPWSA